MVYQLKTFLDLYTAVREEMKISSTDSVSLSRIKRDINIVYTEIVSEHRWWWLQANTTAQVQPYINAGTASVLQNSNSVTLSVVMVGSKTGYYFAIDGYNEIYRIESHVSGSATFTLSDSFSGVTNTAATYKVWTDRVPLPVDCKETFDVWHDHLRSPLENVGQQEFRRVVSSLSKAEGVPQFYYTGDFIDPVQALAIASLPGLQSRASAGVVKTLIFAASLPSTVVLGSRLRISAAGDPSYNGDVIVASITTTNVSNDTITYTGRSEYTESATFDGAMVVQSLGNQGSADRYRPLYLHPSLSSSRVTLHIDYIKEAIALDADSDEPLIPVEDRVILLYGALHRAWSRERNPEEAQRNYTLYTARLERMAGKLQDTFDKPRITPSKMYLGAKRSATVRRGTNSDMFSSQFPSGGGGGTSNVTGSPNTVAVFDAAGVIKGDTAVSTTVLEYGKNVTSDIQAQLNSKQAAGDYIDALTGDVTASGPGSAAATVVTVGGSTASAISAGVVLANTATDLDTASALVKRDASGNFAAGTITANLTGTASGNIPNSLMTDEGDTIYGGAAGAATRLPGNTTTTKNFLTSTGTGTAANDPAWGTIASADLPTVTLTGDISGSASGGSVTTSYNGTVPIAKGGTNAVTQQEAINSLTGTQASGKYLRSDGTNSTLSSIQAADVPTLNQNTTGTAANVTGTVAVENGGTGNVTATAAFNALSPVTSTGDIIVGNGVTSSTRLPIGSTGQVLTVSSGTAAWTTPSIGELRNLLLNSNFDLWQRGTSTTVANGASAYLADRWYVKNSLGTNGVITYSQVAGTSKGAKYGCSVQISTAPTVSQTNGTELYQTLENLDAIQLYNQSACFSVQIKALGNVNQVGVQFFYNTSEAKVSTAIGSEVLTTVNSTGFTQCAISGQALGTAMTTSGVVGVRIRITGVSAGNTYDLNNGFIAEQAMLNLGSSVAAFQRAGRSFTDELLMCQRFYEKTYDLDTAPGAASSNGEYFGYLVATVAVGTAWGLWFKFAAVKRATPTMGWYSNTGTAARANIGGTDVTTDTYLANTVSAIPENNSASGQGGAGINIHGHWTADAEI